MGSWLFRDIVGNLPVAFAASPVSATLPAPHGNYTLQDFLKQGKPYKASDSPLGEPANRSHSTPLTASTRVTPQNLSSTQPPTMKAASQSIAASALTASPTTLLSSAPGSKATPSSPAISLVGTDAGGTRLEVRIPAGALDLSTARTTKGTAPQGGLTVTLSQISGYFLGLTTELGEYQLQFVDSQGGLSME